MWLSRRAALGAVLAGATLLGGCGFAPAYGPGSAGNKLLGQVLVDAPAGRQTYLLTQQLEGRLGRATAPVYALSVTLENGLEGVGLSATNVTGRVNLTARAQFELREIGGQDALVQGTVESFTGYSTAGTPVATSAAARNAELRLMVILADMIVNRLLAAADTLP